MPCHDTGNEQNKENNKTPMKHCKGLCLCFHTAISKTPIIPYQVSFAAPQKDHAPRSFINDGATYWLTSPPQRPPKIIS